MAQAKQKGFQLLREGSCKNGQHSEDCPHGKSCSSCDKTLDHTAFFCGECGSELYCSARCREDHLPDHIDTCLGSWMILNRGFRGDAMSRGQRFAPPPAADRARLCHWCYRLAPAGKPAWRRCSRCRIERYCSVACQSKDWKAHHKSVCVRRCDQDSQNFMSELQRQAAASQDLMVECTDTLYWDVLLDGRVVSRALPTEEAAERVRNELLAKDGRAYVVRPFQVTRLVRKNAGKAAGDGQAQRRAQGEQVASTIRHFVAQQVHGKVCVQEMPLDNGDDDEKKE